MFAPGLTMTGVRSLLNGESGSLGSRAAKAGAVLYVGRKAGDWLGPRWNVGALLGPIGEDGGSLELGGKAGGKAGLCLGGMTVWGRDLEGKMLFCQGIEA